MKALLLIISILITSVGKADPHSTHGMLLFGNKATYASHLPMFHPPHNYQVILKLSLNSALGVLEKYETLKQNGETLFTLVPEMMDLTKIIEGTKKNFAADIYLGHFEKGGTKIGAVNVAVEKVIWSTKLNPNGSKNQNQYLVFGENDEYFAAHLIEAQPSFDAIVAVDKLQILTVNHCRTKNCSNSVTPLSDTILPLTLSGPEALPKVSDPLHDVLSGPFTQIKQIIYIEQEELQ